jgi:hypothetical protein
MRLVKIIIPILIAIGVLLSLPSKGSEPLELTIPFLGDQNAPTHMIVYEDLDCESCKHFHTNVFPFIQKNYIATGKVKYTAIIVSLNKDKNTLNAMNYCYLQSGEAYYQRIDDYYYGRPITPMIGCNTKQAFEYLNWAEKSQQNYSPEFLQAPLVLINGTEITHPNLSKVTKGIEEWLKKAPH